MTATATTSTWKPTHGHTHSRSSRPSTTPRAHPAVSSVGQAMPPSRHQSPPARSPQPRKSNRSPSPGYFGLAVNDEPTQSDSNPGQHAKQNWIYPNSSKGSVAATPRQQSNETNPAFDAFRRQSQTNGFALNNNVAGVRGSSGYGTPTSGTRRADESPMSPHTKRPLVTRFESNESKRNNETEPSFFDLPKQGSPMSMSPAHFNVDDHQQARLSLPASELKPQLSHLRSMQRSETLPVAPESSGPSMLSSAEIAEILQTQSDDVLLLDLRVFPQYAAGRIKGALNLCIPTTLLKRPSFTVQKLADTFTSDYDKEEFAKWQDCAYIIVYDANSNQAKEALTPINVLKKFITLGWTGKGIVIKGGFQAFSKSCPKLVETGARSQSKTSAASAAPVPAPNQATLAVAGGCSMPAEESAANPFFGNIRQNMDLLDGVGQMPIKKPATMSDRDEKSLPAWLRRAAGPSDAGKQVSDKFLGIERGEQKRMQQALSVNVSYGTPSKETPGRIQIAGIEKGSKNRYNNIFPFDHSRVKLQGVSAGTCDYINANHVQASLTNRKYIATQAPIPTTFEDFWRVVWEQDVRVIVMLTAEAEGGQAKAHTYWNTGDYGAFKLKKLSERQVSLEKHKTKGPVPVRPTLGTRRSTQPHTGGEKRAAEEQKAVASSEVPTVVVRHFSLSHSQHPFQPMKEITQLQYTQWPDFGAPASPTAILGLIEQVNRYIRSSSSPTSRPDVNDVAPPNQQPILVHCSAGCGRTGTFCTIDSVIDMLKRQKSERNNRDEDMMDIDTPDNWVSRDDIDLVARTVDDFRHQRLSMVQNLRQFVLCYESVLQWIVSQDHDDTTKFQDGRGRSFQGSLG